MQRFPTLHIAFLSLLLAACSSAPEPVVFVPSANHQGHTLVEQETAVLAEKLFPQLGAPHRIAIGSILPASQLDSTSEHPALIQQIQEGLFSEAVHHNLFAFEHRLTQQIRLQESQEQMLSREASHIRRYLDVDYFLTGTYTEAVGGYVVNARLVNIHDQQVVYAASHYFPKYSNPSDAPH